MEYIVAIPLIITATMVLADLLGFFYKKLIKSDLYINYRLSKLGVDRNAPDLIYQDIHYFFEQQVIFNSEKKKIAKFHTETMMPIGCRADDFIGIYLYMSIEDRKKSRSYMINTVMKHFSKNTFLMKVVTMITGIGLELEDEMFEKNGEYRVYRKSGQIFGSTTNKEISIFLAKM